MAAPAIDAAFLADYRRTVDQATAWLLACSDADASVQPAPGRWSNKEIVGHLIDSAVNNYARFVRAQLQDDMVFPAYDQDAWVRTGRHQERPWLDLVRLWQAANHQIAHIMETADRGALTRPRRRHNLDELAFRPVAQDDLATLAYFMDDYVAHLKHHVDQLRHPT